MTMVIRPARMDDIPTLTELGRAAGPGMTNTPADPARWELRVRESLDSLGREVAFPGQESYLFVLEDSATGQAVGTSAILATIGVTRPCYSFKLLHLAHTSRELDYYEAVPVLQMVNEYRGATEVATLFLHPDYRRDGNGRLLSRVRFLFMANFPERFNELVMAEMRGVCDEQGYSPFWDNLGRHFFNMEFTKADYLSAQGKYQFIADLMPKHPIYVKLLPKEAQAVIGQPHPFTKPALELLKREGFSFEGCVDVFDAGPTIHCRRDQIRTVVESRVRQLTAVRPVIQAERYMVGNTELAEFRATVTALRYADSGGVEISAEAAAVLRVRPGDYLRVVPF
ncbi:MAG TPA: arginine N-succinyltransferase [Candidatus Competibacteraceae bacterium]|nr:arginine N-succinyltransferase [Candidatus Competibacteraceae bacterium]